MLDCIKKWIFVKPIHYQLYNCVVSLRKNLLPSFEMRISFFTKKSANVPLLKYLVC